MNIQGVLSVTIFVFIYKKESQVKCKWGQEKKMYVLS